MWIYLNNSHISIVETPNWENNRQLDKDGNPYLSVRARSREDLMAFTGVEDWEVHISPERDYMARVFLPRNQVSDLVAKAVKSIDYCNFKGSIPIQDNKRSLWYSALWSEGLSHNP